MDYFKQPDCREDVAHKKATIIGKCVGFALGVCLGYGHDIIVKKIEKIISSKYFKKALFKYCKKHLKIDDLEKCS